MGIEQQIAGKLFGAVKKKVKDAKHDHDTNSQANYSRDVNHGKVEDHNEELPPLEVQVYCHNIRQENNNMMEGETPWSQRKAGVIQSIVENSANLPTLVGLQEVKQNMLNDVMDGLGKHWTYFGVGRSDGKSKGEFAPILYQPEIWSLKQGKTYWLGQTPDRPSKGWDAALERIVTVCIFQHKQSGKVVTFLNTHYDHKGKLARENSSKQIIDIMKSYPGASILVGDFNSQPHQEAYKTLSTQLKDTSCNCKQRRGPEHTITGFKRGEKETSIDFIWTTPGINILHHEVKNHEFNGHYCSDHRPVTAVVQI
ncbi:hypothetical protein JA9_001013 [Meyerozyma sp. JA9]|nr:hypothetical protein JA9_001013 [Meyerozyma sp. JA9]